MFDKKEYSQRYEQQAYVVARRREARATRDKVKEETPCANCGKFYAACQMDYDHLPGTEKLFNVSKRSGKSHETEAAKCDLVCANCHRIRTRDRRLFQGTEKFTTTSGGYNREKTRCKFGHEFTEANTYFQSDGKYTKRRCRECGRLRSQDRRNACNESA